MRRNETKALFSLTKLFNTCTILHFCYEILQNKFPEEYQRVQSVRMINIHIPTCVKLNMLHPRRPTSGNGSGASSLLLLLRADKMQIFSRRPRANKYRTTRDTAREQELHSRLKQPVLF